MWVVSFMYLTKDMMQSKEKMTKYNNDNNIVIMLQ